MDHFVDAADLGGIKSIQTIEWLRWDYKRRLGNIVLQEVRYLQGKTYKRDPKKKYKSNDRYLKKKIAMSNRAVSKGIDSFLSSAAELFSGEVKAYHNRLREIEEEMQEEYEKEQEEAQAKETERVNSRWNFEKGD